MGNCSSYNFKDLGQFDATKKPNVEIQYCGGWGYFSKANNFKQAILEVYPNAVINFKKDNGVTSNFNVRVNEKEVYNKKENGNKFPECTKELAEKIKNAVEN